MSQRNVKRTRILARVLIFGVVVGVSGISVFQLVEFFAPILDGAISASRQWSAYRDAFVPSFVSVSNVYFDSSIVFFVLANSSYGLILLLGLLNARRQFVDKIPEIGNHFSSMRVAKPISILVPCYNEQIGIAASLRSMLNLDYPQYEVVVCNDGSTDQSMNEIINNFALFPISSHPPRVLPCGIIRQVYRSRRYDNLIVIDKENGGKSDALNAAINYSQYPLVCCVDADSLIDPHGLSAVALPFLEDDRTVATGGTILLANTNPSQSKRNAFGVDSSIPNSWLAMIQSVEYLRAFMVGRLGWDFLGCAAVISGAFGLYRKSVVIKVGGYSVDTLGEDMELLLRIHAYCREHGEDYVVRLLPDPVCWTEPPTDIRTLKSQRSRWTQGLAESLWMNRRLFYHSWGGRIGFVALPYFLIFELLSAPIEVVGYLIIMAGFALDVSNPTMVAAFLAVTIVFGCILNLGAVVIDQLSFQKYQRVSDLLKLCAGAILEHFGFRQLHLYWRVLGISRWLRGKGRWGKMRRRGLGRSGYRAKLAIMRQDKNNPHDRAKAA